MTNSRYCRRSHSQSQSFRRRVRRLALASIVTGLAVSGSFMNPWISTSIASEVQNDAEPQKVSETTQANPIGGISILVHRFDESPSNIASATHDSVPPADLPPVALKTAAPTDLPPKAVNLAAPTDLPPKAVNLATPTDLPPKAVKLATPTDLPPKAVKLAATSKTLAKPEIVEVAAVESNEAEVAQPSKPTVERRTSSGFDQMVAAAVASSAARIGIPFEQVLEPFAMVGPMQFGPVQLQQKHAIVELPASDAPAATELKSTDAILGIADAENVVENPSNEQLAQAVALNRWWLDEDAAPGKASDADVAKAQVVEEADEVAAIDEALMDAADEINVHDEIAQLASEEPLDVSDQEASAPQQEPSVNEDIAVEIAEVDEAREAIEIASVEQVEGDQESVVDAMIVEASPEPAADLVGSAPVIVTIQDEYLPYDLAARDLEVVSLPLMTIVPLQPQTFTLATAATKSFVEASPSENSEADAKTSDLELPQEPVHEAFAQESAPAHFSPECALDELVWQTSDFVSRYGVDQLSLTNVGQSLGNWIASTYVPGPSVPENVVENAVLVQAETQVDDDAPATPEVAVAMIEVDGEDIPAPVADPVPDMDPIETIAKMEVEGEVVPAPVADPIPNLPASSPPTESIVESVAPGAASGNLASEIMTMEVNGETIPAPTPDPLTNVAPEETLAVMEVDGQVIPAPVADNAADVDPEELIARISSVIQEISQLQDELFEQVIAESADASIAEAPQDAGDSIVR